MYSRVKQRNKIHVKTDNEKEKWTETEKETDAAHVEKQIPVGKQGN